jgi:hypothetical protein
MASPEHHASLVLDELCITSLEDLQTLDLIAYARGATVVDGPLPGAEARLVAIGRRAIITISDQMADSRRRRFSVAHEMGHLELHRLHSKVFLCTGTDLDTWTGRHSSTELEREANEFAAALLLPKRFVASLCNGDPSLGLIARIADTCGVSLTATAIRYLRFCDEACAVVFSQGGHIKWFRGSEEFDEIGKDTHLFIDVRSRLDPTTLAAAFFAGRSMQDRPKSISASAWFESGNYRRDATVVEQSWPMPNYDAVLTLLWIDDDIEYDDDQWL